MRQSWLKRVSKMAMRALSGKAAPSRLVCCAKCLPNIILIIRAEDRASGEATHVHSVRWLFLKEPRNIRRFYSKQVA